MQQHLFFICPTDCLEPIIHYTFGHSSCYYTSLGNSVSFDNDTMRQIEQLIKKNKVKEISFVLAKDNQIVVDALGNQVFSDVRGLPCFYQEITQQKEHSIELWQASNYQLPVISHYLNRKVKELQFELHSLGIDEIKIGGKIYQSQEGIFNNTYPDLIYTEYMSLN